MAEADKVQKVGNGDPREPIVESIRVDKVGRGAKTLNSVRAIVAVIITLILLIPVAWMVLTTFKSQADAIAVPPKVIFEPRPLDSFVFLFTDRYLLPQGKLNQYPEECRESWSQCLANDCADPRTEEKLTWYECVALASGQMVTGPGKYLDYVKNSVIIAGLSTLAMITEFFT